MNQELGQRETVVQVLAGANVPQVGDGATEYCWSDRHAYTVVAVVSPTCLKIQRDIAKCTNYALQDYSYERDLSAMVEVIVFKVTKRHPAGKWVRKTEGVGGNRFSIGVRREYLDPSF